jgi:hypothetical protein
MVRIDNVLAHSEESEPGGKSVDWKPNTSSSKPNTPSSAGKENGWVRLDEVDSMGVALTRRERWR